MWKARSQAAYHGILPLVRHRDHVGVQHVEPFRVPHVLPGGFEQRMALVLAQPLLQVEVVVLLAPQHSRQRLAVHPALIFAQRLRRDPLVEFVRVADPAFEYLLEIAEGIFYLGGRQPQADRLAAAAGHFEDIVGRGLGPHLGGIHRLALSRDDVIVERILDVGRSIGLAPETLRIALILGEQQLRSSIAIQPVLAQFMVGGLNDARRCLPQRRLCDRPRPTTTCSGTTASATAEAGPLPARDCER